MSGVRRTVAFRLGLAVPGDARIERDVAVEVPVALEYNGLCYAVMMASPHEPEEFALGFSLSEGLIQDANAIEAMTTHEAPGGWVVRMAISPDAMEPVIARARVRVTEGSCGLCGMDNIEQVLRPLPPIRARLSTSRAAIARALDALADHQQLGRQTGAMHAAAFCAPDGAILAATEDVGRHNALDRLIGRLAREGLEPAHGFMLLSARGSYELVEKAARAGCPLLVTISAPTSLAIDRARDAGVALVALARADSALIFSDPNAIFDHEGANDGL